MKEIETALRTASVASQMHLHPLTSSLPSYEREKLRAVVAFKSYKRNQRVLARGQHASSIYCVATGLLRVTPNGRSGEKDVTTDFIRPNEFYLPPSFREDEFESPATVLAALPTIVRVIPLKSVRALFTKHPTVLMGLLEYEAKRVEILRSRLGRAAMSSTEEIVGCVLHELTQLAPSRNGGYDKRITQAIIASYVGISRELVNKTMKDMEHRGLIIKDEHGVRVHSNFSFIDSSAPR